MTQRFGPFFCIVTYSQLQLDHSEWSTAPLKAETAPWTRDTAGFLVMGNNFGCFLYFCLCVFLMFFSVFFVRFHAFSFSLVMYWFFIVHVIESYTMNQFNLCKIPSLKKQLKNYFKNRRHCFFLGNLQSHHRLAKAWKGVPNFFPRRSWMSQKVRIKG